MPKRIEIMLMDERFEFVFCSFDMICKHMEDNRIPLELYRTVYAYEDDSYDLEKICQRFNIDLPEDYYERSLSVSDIVAVTEEDGRKHFFFCDSFGWVELAAAFERRL